MDVKSKEYQEHQVFSDLDKYIDFYDGLSDMVMSYLTSGTRSFINIDTYVYSSMKGTLESIKTILLLGRINDAYSLLRKFYDSVYINIYTTLYLEDNIDIQNFTVKQIQDWLNGTDKLPNVRTMSNYIRTHKNLTELNELLSKESGYSYAELRDRCNDNSHYNFYENILLNDNQINNDKRGEALKSISLDIAHLIIFHISLIFHLKQHYMASSDYIDYMDMGETPPEDSQYWVAPFVQDIFDSVITKLRPDITDYVKATTAMHIN